jgi:malate synthase
MAMTKIIEGFTFPEKFWTHENQEILTPELLKLVARLHQQFNPRRLELLKARSDRQKEYNQGKLPEYLDRNSDAVSGEWKVAPIPEELNCRRVEITGPVNSAKMVINMLSRNESGARADMAMLDFEDSMKPSLANVLDGYRNVIGAVSGTLSHYTADKTYKLDPQDMAYVMVRVRGLHLNETNLQYEGTPVSAGLLDLAACFFHTAKIYRSQNKAPKYYVPKCEHYLEARWWNELFSNLENSLDFPEGTLRATFLIETLPATFQVEEILYEIRTHAAGLNVGRWDKIFSDIKVLRNHKDRIMPDRGTINMTKPWMENYAKRVIQICHNRGAFAMGGMSAFTPGKTPDLREEQTRKVIEDKKREASWGHDGCWVSHPYFIGVAMGAFERRNQLDKNLPEFDKYSSILPEEAGLHTLSGLRTNIRVGIAYMHGWRKDIGCVAFDNLMEDLATLEISRAQVWQWLHHGITLNEGMKVNSGLIKKVFLEECEKIIQEMGEHEKNALQKASQEAQDIYLMKELPEFLSLASEPA